MSVPGNCVPEGVTDFVREMLGGAAAPMLAVARSSSAGVLLLGVESGSGWSEAVTSAVLVIVPVLPTSATIWSVADEPLVRLATAHAPVPEVYVPALGVAETKQSPAGRRSVTTTFVALVGPALVSVSVKVTF